jgi:hypothetical protein
LSAAGRSVLGLQCVALLLGRLEFRFKLLQVRLMRLPLLLCLIDIDVERNAVLRSAEVLLDFGFAHWISGEWSVVVEIRFSWSLITKSSSINNLNN